MKKFDIGIIGAGPAGYTLAIILAKKGKKVALFEANFLGGTCVNRGCIPTKTILRSAKVRQLILESQKYGISSEHKYDLQNIFLNARNNSEKLRLAIKDNLQAAGVEIFNQKAELLSKNIIKTENDEFQVEKVILATGSEPRKILIENSENAKIITSDDLLLKNHEFEELTIIGGGVIALEFANFYATFDRKITIIESNNEFFLNFDDSIKKAAKSILKKQKIELLTGAKIVKYDNDGLIIQQNGNVFKHKTKNILIAIGRTTENFSFKNLNLEKYSNGLLKVNEFFQTSEENIYAIGDLNGIMMLSTSAYKQGDVVAKHILTGNSSEKFVKSNIPFAIYTNPEISFVGKSEKDLVNEQINFDTVEILARNLPRAHANLDFESGFVKINFEKDTYKILSAAIFLEESSILINQIALAISKNMTIFDLQESAFTHPTLAESLYYISRNIRFSSYKK
ncbi:dihydrolipoyl dehydrogenase [Mycoplasma sp. 'Moose RK']|uniref:dihydrolipoyl dehydrogenase n=1 Tax=Mycoplasma sp. 'Moose RK' TaxID=2780095 RepID=UPI0018C2888A|nr:dihydrolipoyl dehydrogenase [Mycoplasma sp. 'Moose RK']MBG0730554.1 dihydrolipoyl dehydrogenase [Mycoplasma sp. 'Moose RK']